MRPRFADGLPPVVRLAFLFLATLAVLSAVHACTALQNPSRLEFQAVLIDTESKKPVPSARVILARKAPGKDECMIDTSLTSVTNERGEARIPNLQPGEYVVFYNLSGRLDPRLKGKVVTYGGHADALAESLGPTRIVQGGLVASEDGGLSLANGVIESLNFDIRMIITAEGAFLTVRVPCAPVRIDVPDAGQGAAVRQEAPKSSH
jgi:hypothetical protein